VGRPLASTAGNFLLATPIALVFFLLFQDAAPATALGVGLAVTSGAVTSGLGYALWYSVLPRLEASQAAVAQLCVPMIAMAGGILFLDESLTVGFAVASVLILGGVGLSVRR
jgi:drug/metabolite transporter (DMT)-like permease